MCHIGGEEEDTEEGETVSERRTKQVLATSTKEEVLFEADERL